MSDDSTNQQLQPADSTNPFSGPSTAVLVLLATLFLFVAAQVIGGLIVGFYAGLQHWSQDQTSMWLSTAVGAQFTYGLIADALLIGGVMLVMRKLRWTWATIGLKRPALNHLILGLLATVPYYMLYLGVVIVISAVVPALNIDQKQEIGFDSVHGSLQLAMTFASLVILPPLAEEITMRGFLYTGLRKWLPKLAAALVVSGLFGAAHLAEGGAGGPLWIGAIDTFTLSLVLVYLREKTGNLWAGIVLHASKNFIAFLMLFIIGGR